MDKKELRDIIRQRKRQLSEQELRELSLAVIRRLCQDERLAEASTVLLYYSMADEVFTHDLVERLYREGRTVLLPRVVDGERMEIVRYTGRGSLREAGRYRILEPEGEAFGDLHEIEVAVVPGMAFDAAGHRLGRGRGYYDRTLSLMPDAYKIGLCFPFQMVEEVPVQSTDIAMDEVVS